MINETKQMIEHLITSPKAGYFAVIITTIENWWLDWGNPIASVTTTVLGIVLLIVLIRYHLQNTTKLIRENSKHTIKLTGGNHDSSQKFGKKQEPGHETKNNTSIKPQQQNQS